MGGHGMSEPGWGRRTDKTVEREEGEGVGRTLFCGAGSGRRRRRAPASASSAKGEEKPGSCERAVVWVRTKPWSGSWAALHERDAAALRDVRASA